ncbi:MAG: hypothetical protein BM564_11860 [Bacteroidetes bacterium MedPE-SWsnd-G2]|nr:MAG: hypothetical protein BM564_11860 [Bacteroidetes bacterium MedPE-SWsnd-G2]
MTKDIWDTFHEELYGFIKSRVNDDELSKDLLQEVFVKIHNKVDSLEQKDKLASWVYQITRNTIIDYYRSKKMNSLEEFDIAEKQEEIPQDFSNCLRPFIEDLSQSDKDIIEQTAFKQMSQKEYAELHGLTYSAAKSRLQRARKKLKTAFVDCCKLQSDVYGNIIDSENCDC